MYQSTAACSFEKPAKTITTVEESSLKFEIKKFNILCSADNAESIKVELLSIDAVWWVTVTISLDQNKGDLNSHTCTFTVNLQAKPEGSYVSKNFGFNVEAKIGDIQCFGPSTLQANVIGKWKFDSVARIPVVIRAIRRTSAIKLAHVDSSKGSLVFDFKLTVVHESNGTQIKNFDHPTAMKNEIVANHTKMLGSSTFSDFTFIVQGKQFKVHKVILAAASEVFEKLFTTKMEESDKNECTVTHLDPTAFEHMLRFIYSGKLPETFNDKMAQDLYEAAHYYDLKTLKQVCEPEVLVGLNVDNALELYKWSQVYDLEELKKEAWVTIKRDLLKIFFPLENEPLSSDEIQEILQHKANEQEYWRSHKRVKLSTDDPKP